MRSGLLIAAACLASFAAVSRPARADSMAPALERLVYATKPDGTASTQPCADMNGRYQSNIPVGGAPPCSFRDADFKRLINQYGFAFAPPAFYPARTTGYGGFQVAIQGSVASSNHAAQDRDLRTQRPADTRHGTKST